MSDLFTVRDVARLFDLQEARLRYWAQTGFVGPSVRRGARAFYSFQDLLSVKVAKDLLDGGMPLQRVRKNLDALRSALPHVDRPLSSLRICSYGDQLVVVGEDQAAFEPATGQLVLSLAVSALTTQIAKVLSFPDKPKGQASPPVSTSTDSAYAAFLEGLAAESQDDLDRAEECFRRAIFLDERMAAAWTDFGSILERKGQRGQARDAFEKALALDPEQPEARYNLANLLADVGEVDLAVAEYRRVIAACPELADAHYNLALLYQRADKPGLAAIHLRKYLDLDSDSEWAGKAREMLDSLAEKC
ncbi:MAG: tetratricopeptide repeat protein [Deltaproteobacteria bacterium]|nr:tetratricopeptide repeat protein [Deltaproteobacteria bacterium]